MPATLRCMKEFLVGATTQGREPRWEPLVRAVGEALTGTFMWMYEIHTTDRKRIQAYKHIFTRRYLHLDCRPCAWEYFEVLGEDRYVRVGLADAIESSLRPWWEELDANPDEIADAHDAIERARRAEQRDAA
jgi:hypothetical protein